MPTTPRLALPYPTATDPADVPADIQALATKLDTTVPGIASGSASPPASPYDGQLWYWPQTSGVVWTMRWNQGSSSAYKWEFVGGAPAVIAIDTAESIAATGWGDPPTQGPYMTIVRGGDYLAEFSLGLVINGAPVGTLAACGIINLATGGGPFPSAQHNLAGTNSALGQLVRSDAVAVGAKLGMRYYTADTRVQFAVRHLFITPVRVA